MALLKLSGILDEISGKLGGSILGTSINGSYIKQNSYSQNPNTPKQSLQKTRIGLITQIWRTLSSSQQQDWIDETVNYPYTNRVGDLVEYTGFQLHNLLNLNLQLIEQASQNTPSTFEALVTPSLTFQSLTALDMIMEWTGSNANQSFVFYGSSARSDNLIPSLSTFRLITILTNSGINGTLSVIQEYERVFTYPTVGEKVYMYVKPVNRITGAPSLITNIAVGILV